LYIFNGIIGDCLKMQIFIRAQGRPAQVYTVDSGNQRLRQLLEKHNIRATKAISRGRTVPLDTILDASFSEKLIELI
jgi:hypothetical protein